MTYEELIKRGNEYFDRLKKGEIDLLEFLALHMRDNQEFRKHPHPELGFDRCVRCYEHKKIPYPVKLCDTCQEVLKEHFPEIYEQARLENMRLYDECYKHSETK